MMNKSLCFSVLALISAIAIPAAAQMSDSDLLQQLRADIQADRQAVVAGNLGLSEAEADAFWPVYREYRNDMAKVHDRLQQLIQEYAEIWDVATDQQAEAMIDEMMDIRHDELKVRKSHLSKFRKVLPEVKVARFMQIENKLDAIVSIGLADSIPLIRAGD